MCRPKTKPTDGQAEQLIDAETVASRLAISVRTLYRYVDRGVLPRPIRFSPRCVRWLESEIVGAIHHRTAGRGRRGGQE